MEQNKNFLERLCDVLEVSSESEEEAILDVIRIVKLTDVIRCAKVSNDFVKGNKEKELKDALNNRGVTFNLDTKLEIKVNGNIVPEDVIERTIYLKEKMDKFIEENCTEEERETFEEWKENVCTKWIT